MLNIEALVTGYRNGRILDGIDLEIRRGDFCGILGPNGAGKSTLFRVLIRSLPIWEGTVKIYEKELEDWSHRELAREVALIPQEIQLQFDYLVKDLVLMGRFPYLGYLQNYGIRDHRIVNKLMSDLDLEGFARKPFSELSGGEKQRVSIARALAQETNIILVDEALSGLDIDHQLEFIQLLARINRSQGKTIVLISHNINLVSEYCRRIVLIKKGRLLADGNPEQVVTAENLKKMYNKDFHIINNKMTGKPNLLYPGNHES